MTSNSLIGRQMMSNRDPQWVRTESLPGKFYVEFAGRNAI